MPPPKKNQGGPLSGAPTAGGGGAGPAGALGPSWVPYDCAIRLPALRNVMRSLRFSQKREASDALPS